MEGPTGGNDVELMSKILQFEHKLFYFDLKENPRGRYLKISERNTKTRSTIIVPIDGIVWFLDLLNYYVNTDENDVFRKELKLDAKVFYFNVSENRWGRFLKVSEVSGRNRVTIIVPAGNSGEEGWVAFRDVLQEINEEASRLFIQDQQHLEPSELLTTGHSYDVGADFISGSNHNVQPILGSDLNVDRSVEAPQQDEVGSMAQSKVIRTDQKRFFFDLGSNNRGHFLRISEVAGPDRSSIILPLSGLKQFHEAIGHFLEITKDKLEVMTGTNVRTVESSQR